MSNTYHHRSQKAQHAGQDLWSRRPCSGLAYSAYSKRLTRRTERKQKKNIIAKELAEVLYLDEELSYD